VLILLMRRRLDGLEGGYVWKGVAISALGTALMAAVVIGWRAVFWERSLLIELFGALGVGFAAYLGLMWALKMPELSGMVRSFTRRMRRG